MKQREIKFRAFHQNENGIEGRMYQTAFPTWNGAVQVWKDDKPQTEVIEIGPGPAFGEVYLLQFTGLLDKNGKDIYEGDVIEYKWRWTDGVRKAEMVFDERGLWALDDCDGSPNVMIGNESVLEPTIIGNIHENPELMKP